METKTKQFIGLYILACIFWFLIFGLKIVNFWVGMSIAASVLTLISVLFQGIALKKEDISLKSFFTGIVSALILYGIFYVGKVVSQLIFPFAETQIQNIYGIQNEGSWYAIAFVLFFITSPCEELFWRGYLQKYTVEKWGLIKGCIAAALFYGGVHIFSGNIMLTLAALTAGLYWSFLYGYTKNIFTCFVSHAFWTVAIFVFFPI